MKNIKYTLTALSAASALGMASASLAYPDAITVQQQGNISYVTGGIGEEESAAMQQARPDYNLHVMNSYRDGSFSGDTKITIFDRAGNQVLAADAGPLLYANLPAGKYQIVANADNVEQKKSFTAGASRNDLHFVW